MRPPFPLVPLSLPPTGVSPTLTSVAPPPLTDAAQASRDRKKEHTAFLERRCYELENLLRLNGVVVPHTFAAPPPIVAPATSGSSSASAAGAGQQQHPKGAPPRSQRAFSVLSDDNQGRIADLEDDNDNLRAQLDLEQRESAQLRARLDEADAKLARLAHFAPDAPFSSPFSGTTTPLPAGFEPTFAFDTPNLCPLPQPEERAYVEERERQRRLVSAGPTSTTSTPKTVSTRLDRTSASPSSTTTTAGALEGDAHTTQTTGSSRLVAREVDPSLQRKLSPTL